MALVTARFGVEQQEQEQVYQRTRVAYKHLEELIEASKCPVPKFAKFGDIDPALMTKAIEWLLSDPAAKPRLQVGYIVRQRNEISRAARQLSLGHFVERESRDAPT
jgi:hypothetical protein